VVDRVNRPEAPRVERAMQPVLVLIFRRMRAGRSPFSADRNHLHHHLLEAGVSTTGVVTFLVGLTLAIGFAAANARRVHVPEPLFPGIYLAAAAAYYLLSRREIGGESMVQKLAERVVRRRPGTTETLPKPALAPVRVERQDA
jgi:UDP-GlcNAc:undecaprenyl-phosphate GlcNAc-1-phosphate transferase